MYELPEINTLSEVFVAQHESFVAMRNAGFTKHEIWHILLSQVDCEKAECHRKPPPA